MKKHHLTLSPEDLAFLQKMLTRTDVPARTRERARALLELHRGKSFQDVSVLLGKSYPTVFSWAGKYRTGGLDFLKDKPRSGRPAGITESVREKIVQLAKSDPPAGYNRWTLRLLADKIVELGICGQISHNHVGVILKEMNASLTGEGSM